MTRLEALRALHAAVKDGSATMNHFAAVWPSENPYGKTRWGTAHNAYAGSVDAALALLASTLPGYVWGRQWSGHMWVEGMDLPGRSDRFYGEYPDPARALVLAIIAALIAEEEAK